MKVALDATQYAENAEFPKVAKTEVLADRGGQPGPNGPRGNRDAKKGPGRAASGG